MHAGYGGLQGDRLHAMIMPSALCGQFEDHILKETKHVLLANQVTGKDARTNLNGYSKTHARIPGTNYNLLAA